MPEDRDHKPVIVAWSATIHGDPLAHGGVRRLAPGDQYRITTLDDGTELRIVRTGGEPERGHRFDALRDVAVPLVVCAGILFVLAIGVRLYFQLTGIP